ncbi:MAG: hypothetical protein M1834_005316 [Cirrosporium novae-zelandiae]|nr:MAG: hypothetical protein M1834_005316 [Cirrosporium novae-zelandiae]
MRPSSTTTQATAATIAAAAALILATTTPAFAAPAGTRSNTTSNTTITDTIEMTDIAAAEPSSIPNLGGLEFYGPTGRRGEGPFEAEFDEKDNSTVLSRAEGGQTEPKPMPKHMHHGVPPVCPIF